MQMRERSSLNREWTAERSNSSKDSTMSSSSLASGSSGRRSIRPYAEEEREDFGDIDVVDSSPYDRYSSALDLSPQTSRVRRDSGSSFSSNVDSEEDNFAESDGDHSVSLPRNTEQLSFHYDSRQSKKKRMNSRKGGRAPISYPGFAERKLALLPGLNEKKDPEEILPGPNSTEMSKLVVDYLISEGYREAAELLCLESGIELPMDDIESLDSRVVIRDAIVEGRVDDAIEKVNTVCPGMLDANPEVHFHLVLQNLIEMIRNGDMERALSYSQEHLSYDQNLTDEQLAQMEKTFALWAFPNPEESPFRSLLQQSRRQMVSTEVNSAVLNAMNRPAAPRLEALLRMIVWAQKQLITREGGSEQRINTQALAKELFESKGTAI